MGLKSEDPLAALQGLGQPWGVGGAGPGVPLRAGLTLGHAGMGGGQHRTPSPPHAVSVAAAE